MKHRRDANHAPIVKELEQCGFSVWDTSQAGGGGPDIVVGRFGESVLVELKTEEGQLRDGQVAFARDWRGRKPIVARTAEEIIDHFNTLLLSEG